MINIQSNMAIRVYVVMTAISCWFGLLLQLYLTVKTSLANGTAVSVAVINYLSYFTILTNFLIALALTLPLSWLHSRWGRFFSGPVAQAGIAVYSTIVGAGYSLLLRHTWKPEGMWKLTDILLHDVVPVMYVTYWLFFAPKVALRWKNIVLWLVYPVSYLSYTLVRGSRSVWYPYHFIDASTLGYPRVLLNAGMLLVAFVTIGLLVVAIGRWMGRNSRALPL